MSNNLDPDQPEVLTGLIWIQTVCKSYQHTTLVCKELNRMYENGTYNRPDSVELAYAQAGAFV